MKNPSATTKKNCKGSSLTLLFVMAFVYPLQANSGSQSLSSPVMATDARMPANFFMSNQSSSHPDPQTTHPVVTLISETCQQDGENDYHDALCQRTYSDGSSTHIKLHQEIHGRETKNQTMITEFDSRGTQTVRQTLRRKIIFIEQGNSHKKDGEYLDLVTRPANGKITREFFIYHYDPETQKRKTAVWTKYDQMGSSSNASLTFHVSLTYDSAGNPISGKAEHWKDGAILTKIFEWNQQIQGRNLFDADVWNQWEEKTNDNFLSRIPKTAAFEL